MLEENRDMNTCKDCRYWSGKGNEETAHPMFFPRSFRACNHALLIDDWNEESVTRDYSPGRWDVKAPANALLATAVGDDRDKASIQTGPDFGCIHFEMKQP